MWLKNGTGVSIFRCPDPSSATESSICVSVVTRFTFPRRVMAALAFGPGAGGRGARILTRRTAWTSGHGTRGDSSGIQHIAIYWCLAAPMTKPARSPILGYNHNIQFHGKVFHVQTEDSGAHHARLFTHLFFAGTILASKKEQYDAASPEDAVRLLMQRLHKAMIKELKDGLHDTRILAFFHARGEAITMGDRPSLVQ